MAAKIRLKKVGRRGQPSYRVVVLDGRKPRDAKVVADLGHYDPKTNPVTFEIDGEAALKWLLDGAKATKAARDILSKAGVMAAWDAAKRGETMEIEKKELKATAKKKKAEAKAEGESAEVPAGKTETPEAEAEPEAAEEPVAEEPAAEETPSESEEPEAEQPEPSGEPDETDASAEDAEEPSEQADDADEEDTEADEEKA